MDASNFEDILAYMIMVSLPTEKTTWPDDLLKDRTRLFKRSSISLSDADDNRQQKSRTRFPALNDHYFRVDDAEMSMLILDAKLLVSDKQVHEQNLELPDTAILVVPSNTPIEGTQTTQAQKGMHHRLKHLYPHLERPMY